MRTPAHFWRLVSGDVEITTGSGLEAARLVERLAQALAAGGVRFELAGDDIELTGSGEDAEDLIAAFEREQARDMVGIPGAVTAFSEVGLPER